MSEQVVKQQLKRGVRAFKRRCEAIEVMQTEGGKTDEEGPPVKEHGQSRRCIEWNLSRTKAQVLKIERTCVTVRECGKGEK